VKDSVRFVALSAMGALDPMMWSCWLRDATGLATEAPLPLEAVAGRIRVVDFLLIA